MPMTGDELKRQIELQQQPIDFEALVRDGTLTKVGAWWAVTNIKTLPEHVSAKVSEMKNEAGRTLIRLRAPRKR